VTRGKLVEIFPTGFKFRMLASKMLGK
jgi:hypothetical protein